VPDAKVFYRAAASNRLNYIGLSDRKMEAQLLGMKMQIGYLRTIEDNERVRTACLNYLQTWLGYFYPDRLDLVEKAQELAAEVGSTLDIPHLRWKYAWLRPIFGYDFAQRAQLMLPRITWSMASSWDKMMFRFERRPLTAGRDGSKQNMETSREDALP